MRDGNSSKLHIRKREGWDEIVASGTTLNFEGEIKLFPGEKRK